MAAKTARQGKLLFFETREQNTVKIGNTEHVYMVSKITKGVKIFSMDRSNRSGLLKRPVPVLVFKLLCCSFNI